MNGITIGSIKNFLQIKRITLILQSYFLECYNWLNFTDFQQKKIIFTYYNEVNTEQNKRCKRNHRY